jgi:CRP-like cAMP-binding protein
MKAVMTDNRTKRQISQWHKRHSAGDKPWYIINGEGSPIKRWNFLMSAVLIYVVFYVPYEISFVNSEYLMSDRPMQQALKSIVDIMFYFDLVICFFVSYKNERRIAVYDLRKTSSKYLKSWFLLDLVAAAASVLESLEARGLLAVKTLKLPRMVRLFRFFKLLRLAKILRHFNSGKMGAIQRAGAGVKQVLICTLLIHFLGCFFYLIPVFAYPDVSSVPGTFEAWCREQDNWLSNYRDGDICDDGGDGRYVTSIYWAFTTISTVGYGDVIPVTMGEKIFACVAMMIGAGLYPYLLAQLVAVVNEDDSNKKQKQQLLDHLSVFTVNYNLPTHLSDQLHQHLEARMRESHSISQKKAADSVTALLDKDSPLYVNVMMAVHAPLIKSCKYFEKALVAKEHAFIIDVVTKLRMYIAFEGDNVVQEGTVADCMYIVKSGKMAVMNKGVMGDGKKRCVAVINSGEFFGEIGCLVPEPMNVRGNTVKAAEQSVLYKLDRLDLLGIMQKYPEFNAEVLATARYRVHNSSRVAKSWSFSGFKDPNLTAAIGPGPEGSASGSPATGVGGGEMAVDAMPPLEFSPSQRFRRNQIAPVNANVNGSTGPDAGAALQQQQHLRAQSMQDIGRFALGSGGHVLSAGTELGAPELPQVPAHVHIHAVRPPGHQGKSVVDVDAQLAGAAALLEGNPAVPPQAAGHATALSTPRDSCDVQERVFVLQQQLAELAVELRVQEFSAAEVATSNSRRMIKGSMAAIGMSEEDYIGGGSGGKLPVAGAHQQRQVSGANLAGAVQEKEHHS